MDKVNEAYEVCKKHRYRYVLVQTTDNQQFDAIIADVDPQNVHLAVPIGSRETAMRQPVGHYGQGGGWGGPGSGWGPGGGYYPPGRFNPLVLPLVTLGALTLLPYY